MHCDCYRNVVHCSDTSTWEGAYCWLQRASSTLGNVKTCRTSTYQNVKDWRYHSLLPSTHTYILSLQHFSQMHDLIHFSFNISFLSTLPHVQDDALKSIASGCSGLYYLNLSYCYVTDSMMRILTKWLQFLVSCLLSLSTRIPYLITFSILFTPLTSSSFVVSFITCISLFRFCHSLNYLSLAHCTQFTIKGIQSITAGKGCRKLVHLDLSGCLQVCKGVFLM